MQEHRLELSKGLAWPLGLSQVRRGYNFALLVMNAKEVSIHLFEKENKGLIKKVKLNPHTQKTGNVWHIHITGLKPGDLYIYRIKKRVNSHDRTFYLLDPYSTALYTKSNWENEEKIYLSAKDNVLRLSAIPQDTYHWEDDTPLNTPLNKTIIYEAHVRGFTRHPSSAVNKPATFTGLAEKIPYLKKLGITAIELMPVFDFDEHANTHKNPRTGKRLKNYWGYDPISFFALKNSYAYDQQPLAAINEFRSMVKAMHKAGIEVILDVVFNHSAEGGKKGPVINFKGLANRVYYIMDSKRGYANYSGCGNTINCNHPVVSDMIIKALRYWVMEMHVDGFRFDLASVLCRGKDGQPKPNPPLIDQISHDPVLSQTKLIAEPWDAAGLYQVGSFPGGKSWLEWNGKFRDDVRRFIKGDNNCIPILAKRMYGSSDLYENGLRSPLNSINFISSHDGFPMADLVQYNEKHNHDNGEENRDGENYNHSFNYGYEGPSDNPEITSLRQRQLKNMAAILLLSQGVPMILAGDEFGRSQQGNNNAYCQDNEISWLDWTLLDKNHNLFNFFKKLIAFRKKYPIFTRDTYNVDSYRGKKSIKWHGTELNKTDWSADSKTLAIQYMPVRGKGKDIFIMINGSTEDNIFQLASSSDNKKWKRFLDTYCETPSDIAELGKEFELKNQKRYLVHKQSIVVMVA